MHWSSHMVATCNSIRFWAWCRFFVGWVILFQSVYSLVVLCVIYAWKWLLWYYFHAMKNILLHLSVFWNTFAQDDVWGSMWCIPFIRVNSIRNASNSHPTAHRLWNNACFFMNIGYISIKRKSKVGKKWSCYIKLHN